MDGLRSIFARNCSVCRIDAPLANDFLRLYHRLGCTGGRYRYGLFVERSTGEGESILPKGTMVAVAVFSNARRWTKGERKISSYEWIRYASLPGYRIVGGMGKLLDYFICSVHPDDIMSYALSDELDGGDAYSKLGFEKEGIVERKGYKDVKFRKKVTPY